MKLFAIIIFGILTIRSNIDAVPLQKTIPERIVNGHQSVPGQFPHQVLLVIYKSGIGGILCGGSLLNNQWILTAAHCAVNGMQFEVHLGAYTIHNNTESGRIIQLTYNFIIHPNYVASTATNDLALVKLNECIEYSEKIYPVRLPFGWEYANDDDFIGRNAIATGWGLEHTFNPNAAEQLRWATLNIIGNDDCTQYYSTAIIQPTTICAAGEHEESVCNGDSGGPLTLEDDRTLIGVTSFGAVKGCDYGIPQGFSRITRYLDWISENTGIYN